MNSNRRDFLKSVSASAAALAAGTTAISLPAKSYGRVIGANDRLGVGVIGLGRRLGAFVPPISDTQNNVELLYLCDVMQSQRERAAGLFSEKMNHDAKLENDLRKVVDDRKVDVVFNATPDHWHTPGSIMALQHGKHVYVEKPATHNMLENELLVAAQKKYGKVVQMGTQQRSSDHTIEVIRAIHDGLIGSPYRAVAWYANSRGMVPVQKAAPVPKGLDWELFQGPAPRREYTEETWDYNWHWYGWDYGTAETGNNATHEFDVARWALQVGYPTRVDMLAQKRHFPDDGWDMYDTMEATFRFAGNKIIQWDGKSRNGYAAYGSGRGTLIYGTDGCVFINRDEYRVYDRAGELIKRNLSASQEAGTALGGGGDMSTRHVVNFFDTVRGKGELASPIDEGAVTMALVHYSNIAYRIGRGFDIDDETGRMFDRDAMKLWGRDYEPGWEPKL
jgi:predicted dehydrogenase